MSDFREKLNDGDRAAYDALVKKGYGRESVIDYIEDYKDNPVFAMDELFEANSDMYNSDEELKSLKDDLSKEESKKMSLNKDEQNVFDDLGKQNCDPESIKMFIKNYYDMDFDRAWKLLCDANPNLDLSRDNIIEIEEEEKPEKPVDLDKEYGSMAELPPDRQGNEEPGEDKVEGVDLDEVYPKQTERIEKDKKVRGDSLEDQYESMSGLPPDKEDSE